MPLVSIIIPCYNYSNYLVFTLESLQVQVFKDWECLIIDDGSTDDTKLKAETFIKKDLRYRYIYQEQKGVSAARNNGIAQSRGSYIQFLDADDFLEPNKLEKQVQLFQQNASLHLVYSSARYFRNSNPEERLYFMGSNDVAWIPEFSGPGHDLLPTLMQTNIFPIHSPLIKKEALIKVGYFNESMKYLEDWEYWFRCASQNLNFFYCDSSGTLALVRVHETSVSNKKWEFRLAELHLKNNYFRNYINNKYLPELHKDVYQLKRRLINLATVDLFKGNVKKFSFKINQVTNQASSLTSVRVIIKESLWPIISWKMLVKGGKALLK